MPDPTVFADPDELRRLFLEPAAPGTAIVSKPKVKACLPLLVALGQAPVTAVVSDVLGELGELAGVRPETAPEEVEGLLLRYYEAHPPDPQLLDGLRRWLERATHGAFSDGSESPACDAVAHTPIPQKEVW